MSVLAILFVCSFFISWLYEIAIALLCIIVLATIADFFLLFLNKGNISGSRQLAQRFSMGDENPIEISITNSYSFTIVINITEQLPFQFQVRDFQRIVSILPGQTAMISYALRPLERGMYDFGELLAYVQSPLNLLQRRCKVANAITIKVYPSFLQLKKFQLEADAANIAGGIKKIRRLGHSLEFEKIKSYVHGDDIRTINWKATARTGGLMVNTYTDTREQQVYAVIDKGRAMKMPFNGMTLLDYAINASLLLLNVALSKHDKAGLVTFSNKPGSIVPAEKRAGQLQRLLETLYHQQTDFKESDYEILLSTLHKHITQRSFLLFFTNFETLSSLERQLPFLIKLASQHLVCVVFFQNTLLKNIHDKEAQSTEDIYIKTIAERFDFEKKQIVRELRKRGIIALLTPPEQLNINVINQYLELKSRQMI